MQTTTHTATARAGVSEKPTHGRVSTESYDVTLPGTGYVRLPVVVGVCGLAKSTIWKWASNGRFPKPVKLSARVSAWHVADIRAWLDDPAGWPSANAEAQR